jgi:hypothetical protein
MAKSIDLPGYFTCPQCVVKDNLYDSDVFFPVHLEPGLVLGGTRYCQICGEELLDVLVMGVHEKLLAGSLTWGGKHFLALVLRPRGIHEVTVACPCEHGGITRPFIFSLPAGDYWGMLAAFVTAHYPQLKAIIG